MATIPEGYVAQDDAARYLGVPSRTIRFFVRQGRLTQYRLALNRRWRLYRTADLDVLKLSVVVDPNT